MAQFCGGVKLDATSLKQIEGVICEASSLIIDESKAVSACGQKWDGDSFQVKKVKGVPCITPFPVGETVIGDPIPVKANCGVAVDGRFFTVGSSGLELNSGYLLKVDATPTDAMITVLDASSEEIDPIAGTTNQYIASGNVSVSVEKDGYIGKTQTVNMNDNKEISVTIYPIAELTVNVTTPESGATITVTDADSHALTPKTGTTNVFQCAKGATYTVAVSATGYTTSSQSVSMTEAKTVTVALEPEG